MKRGSVIFLAIFLMSTALATPSLTFQNNKTQPGETILATISTVGNFEKEIGISDIKFYSGRKQVSFESDIKFYAGTYYLYIYTTREGNFSVEISEVLYKESDTLQSTTITKPFNIIKEIMVDEETNATSTEILQIKPGLIYTIETPVVKLINKGTTTLEITYEETEISLQPAGTYDIITVPEEVFSYLNISTYKEFAIPIVHPTANATFISPSAQIDLRQNPQILSAELFTNTKTDKIIELFNFGNQTLTDFQIVSDLDFIKTEEIGNMSAREVRNFTVTFEPENPGYIEGIINITYTQDSKQDVLTIPVSLFIIPKGSNASDFEMANESCAELSGTVCGSGKICSGKAKFTKTTQEYCCLGICEDAEEDKPKGGSSSWIIGVLILAGLAGGGYYFYKKQKKIAPKNPEEQMKESTEKYAERFKGKTKSERVKGGLTKS